MIFWGIVLLVIGLLVWLVARLVNPVHPGLVSAGVVVAVIGLILLVVGIILNALAGPNDVHVDGLRALVGL